MGEPRPRHLLYTKMNRAEYVESRRRRYLAQAMEGIEDFDAFIPPDHRDEWEAWKARLRRKFQALATDATKIMNLKPEVAINEAASDLRDRLDLRA